MAKANEMSKATSSKYSPKNIIIMGIVVIGLICLVVIGINLASFRNNQSIDYSVKNEQYEGYSTYYKVLKKLGLVITTSNLPVKACSTEACQILMELENDQAIDDAFEWIEDGGTLVYIYPGEGEEEDDITVENYGKGILIQVNNGDLITNGALEIDTQLAYELYTKLMIYVGDKDIYINEYYLANPYNQEQPNLWDIIPLSLKVVIIQLGIVGILIIIYLGKRFGKVEALYEETERASNEYLYSVSKLYRQVGAWDLVCISYYQTLEEKLRKLTGQQDDLLKIWEKSQLPELDRAKTVATFMRNNFMQGKKTKVKFSKQEVMPILASMLQLIKIVDKRREAYWKH